MKTILLLSLLSILSISCSRNSQNKIVVPEGHNQPPSTNRIVIRSSDGSAESQRITGPTPLLMGPEALQEVYKGVFSDSLSETRPSFFNGVERDELGGFRILQPSNPRGGFEAADPVMKKNAKLSADYIFALRKFTAASCKVLIDKEMQELDRPSNLLVEGSSPSIGKIDQFLSQLLGYKSRVGIHPGVQNYKDAFEKMKASSAPFNNESEKLEHLKVTYNHLCVALATDVRVYVR